MSASMFDLASITLTLLPSQHGQTPRWLGRTIHAWFLDSLQSIHPMFSNTLHNLSIVKPFTISNLIGAKVQGNSFHFDPNHLVKVRLTTLHPQLTLVVLNQVLPAWHQQKIMLHSQLFTLQKIDIESGWSGCTTFEQLLKQTTSTQRNLTLHFASPTTFKRTGDYFDAMPYPMLIFGSLLDRWNTFSPVTMPPKVNLIFEKRIGVHYYAGNHETIHLGGKRFNRPIPTFSGKVQFYLAEEDPILRRYVHVLADFAKFSGVGYKTTMGFGQVRAS